MAGQTQLRLGTRGSPLALAQATETRTRLAGAHGWPDEAVAIVPIRTTGDMIQDRALSEAGGKGLFTKELDRALLDGTIDLAVHSAKDLPTVVPDGLAIAGYLPREDVRDALIAAAGGGLDSVRQGGTIGTASLRRQAQLLRKRPDLTVLLLRGNVGSRLRRVEDGEFDATLLALAGLNRLGLARHATAILEPEDFLPAVGQGAIALMTREGDAAVAAALAPVIDTATTVALSCERAFLSVLDGSCRTPIAGHAGLAGDVLTFRGCVLSPDGRDAVSCSVTSVASAAAMLGAAAAADLQARGAARIMAPPGTA